MAVNFDQLSKIRFNRECVRLKVRVARMWTVPMFNNPTQTSSLELILLDQDGGKIQASVRKPLLYKFSPMLEEGAVYKMVYFNVVPNNGNYRGTHHEFKLVFLFKTTVVKMEDGSMPEFGFSFIPFNEVVNLGENHEFLIDVIGVLTEVFPEKQYEKDGRLTNMVVMELTDSTGKLECALFGDYVDQLRSFVNQGGNVQVIVILQLARVKSFRGHIVIQNSINATKLMFNPDIPAALSFRNTIAEHGVIDVEPLCVILDNSREGLEYDFMKLHPKKTVAQLKDIQEDGLFIVLGTIVDMVGDGDWFYLACKCNKSVSLRSTVYFCDNCDVPVLQVSPRFKLIVEVVDDSGTAVFVLFDRDVSLLLKKTCEELLMQSFEVPTETGFPHLFANLIGRRLLFKVETKAHQNVHYETTYAVRRICDDEHIVAMFDMCGGDNTPMKATFTPAFPNVDSSFVDLEGSSSAIPCISQYTPTSLGADFPPSAWKLTPAKRCLEPEFLASQLEHPSSKMKSVVVIEDVDQAEHSSAKLKNVVNVEEADQPTCQLVAVKIEKD